ncbi:hypothetical protein J0X19_09015 [Hymenobacter sp. BT186]|uniref:Holliday junction resolvase-related domain-containing protein n=1 Tax=Hymenobacter telluris TaxID=2816474 RepID=A0A939EVQ1_9BACT|nr:Holliday junction resolvase-like protein [Hymenobacter telluris]MBO0358081.1 hypothetical protein [Hymenobacter telluris]MBW3374108.1 hypothetical protein [Hymenobacter norwichensis]
METNIFLQFAGTIIITILFILYYFRGKEIANIKSKEVTLLKSTQIEQERLKRELQALQHKIQAREDVFIREMKISEDTMTENFRLKEDILRKDIENIQLKLNESYSAVPLLANKQFDEFKKYELNNLRTILAESANKSALSDLENWKIKYETFYRQDAINRSQAVILGKVTEHLVPFQKDFPFNPKEARFVGSPIDIIVFDGIDNEDIVNIYILEIKTGSSSLNKRQRLIRDAVINKRVHWRELNV